MRCKNAPALITGRMPEAPTAGTETKNSMQTSPALLAALGHREVRFPSELNVVLVYENLSAIVCAAETLHGLFHRVPDGMKQHLSPWSFAMLGNRHRGTLALAAAAHTDLLVIAASSDVKPFPPAVENWLERCLARRCAARAVVAAVLGFTNRPDRADSPRLHCVQHLAQKAGCEFFAPRVASETLTAVPN